MNNNQHQADTREYSAGVVLFREINGKRKYLILHYPGGHFDFPKGHLEKGETETMAAIRELEEETGISVDSVFEGFSTAITYLFRRPQKLVHKTVTFFLARADSGEIKISHEHQGYLWLDFESALSKITFENARGVLRRAEEFLNKQST